MKVKNFVALIDYPDDVQVTIYDYTKSDTVYIGLEETIPEYYFDEEIVGIEFPSKNEVMLNIKTK